MNDTVSSSFVTEFRNDDERAFKTTQRINLAA